MIASVFWRGGVKSYYVDARVLVDDDVDGNIGDDEVDDVDDDDKNDDDDGNDDNDVNEFFA